jgi:hypothetical protein
MSVASVLALAFMPIVLLVLGVSITSRVIVGAIIRKSHRRVAPGSTELSVLTNIGGKNYYVASDDDYLKQIEGKFEPDLVALLTSLIEPDDTVLDIGANIGCTSILLGNLAKRVFSFEPSPTTFFLQKNIHAAGFDNIIAFNKGLGNADGTFDLTFSPDNRSASHDHPRRIDRHSRRLRTPGLLA